MKKILAALALSIFSIAANASPFIVSDPSIQDVSHCGVYMDGNPVVEVAVDIVAAGARCKFDVGSVTPGEHTVTATFIKNDAAWGRLESASSVPFVFVRPTSGGASLINAPAGIKLER
jgi:hypothetical protein